MGILFSCMNFNDSHTQHPHQSIPKNDGCFRSVFHKRNEYEDISSPSTNQGLEDTTSLHGNHPNNLLLSVPQSSELHVAVSRGTCDIQVAEPNITALVIEENRSSEDLVNTQIIEGIPCLFTDETSLPELCNQLYQVILSPDEEDVCPTCLEDYDPNNPKIVTECSHHFHLSCIYAWMERSNTCPICFRVMVFDEAA